MVRIRSTIESIATRSTIDGRFTHRVLRIRSTIESVAEAELSLGSVLAAWPRSKRSFPLSDYVGD